jgi:folate-binding protein YgfZ
MIVTKSPDFERQYQALRHGNAVVELPGWSSISIRGKDRYTFLHNFCTNDVKRLTVGASCEAFITNVKGKIIGHGLVCSKADELEFVGAPGQAAAIIAHLDRYIIREDVQLRDTTDSSKHLFIVSDDCERADAFSWNGLTETEGRIVGAESDEASNLVAELIGPHFLVVNESAFTVARIEAGFPLFGVDFDENNLPQEIGRDREAISFTKGCYLGQETVARIDALGHVNQRIVGVRFLAEHMPAVGSVLSKDGTEVGRITSVAFSPELNAPLALAMVRREANAVGTRVESPFGKCEVTELPVPKSA